MAISASVDLVVLLAHDVEFKSRDGDTVGYREVVAREVDGDEDLVVIRAQDADRLSEYVEGQVVTGRFTDEGVANLRVRKYRLA